MSHENRMPTGCSESVACLDAWKSIYLDHKMAPESAAWPAGLWYKSNPATTWNCSTEVLNDEPAESCQFSGGCLTQRYGLGLGQTWKGASYSDWVLNGFDNLQVLKFVGQKPARPSTFCGQTLSSDTLGPQVIPTCNKAYIVGLQR